MNPKPHEVLKAKDPPDVAPMTDAEAESVRSPMLAARALIRQGRLREGRHQLERSYRAGGCFHSFMLVKGRALTIWDIRRVSGLQQGRKPMTTPETRRKAGRPKKPAGLRHVRFVLSVPPDLADYLVETVAGRPETTMSGYIQKLIRRDRDGTA